MQKTAVSTDWDIEPMPRKTKKFVLQREFSDEEMEILKIGHIPQEMEDKWFWYFENGRLYAHRSWTGICIFIIEFDLETSKHKVWVNRDKKQYENRDIEEDKKILNGLLNWWVQPKYDYYGEWIDETVRNLHR